MSHTQSETQKKKEEELVNIFINNPDIQAAQSSLRMRFILRKKESLLHRYVRSYNRVLVTKSCKMGACDTKCKDFDIMVLHRSSARALAVFQKRKIEHGHFEG